MKRATNEHYKILNISKKASLDEIKKAYRKRAFELHPDLNPENTDAHKDFQLLNEAYVILVEQASTQTEQSNDFASAETKTQASDKKEGSSYFSFREKVKRPYESNKAEQRRAWQERNKARAKKDKEEKPKASTEKEQARATESHTRTYTKTPNQERTVHEDIKKKASAAYQHEGSKASSYVYKGNTTSTQASSSKEQAQTKESGSYKTPTKEEVLRDILNDPFARRVYEDIYSELKNSKIRRKFSLVDEEEKPKEKKERKILVDWTKKRKAPYLNAGFAGYVKSWLRKQIDDTLEYRIPLASLFPGSRIRLQIAQGLADSTRTVDITLPRDFAIGKPVRLVGMGKKLGKWQGDLYLTLLPVLPK